MLASNILIRLNKTKLTTLAGVSHIINVKKQPHTGLFACVKNNAFFFFFF
mgnify:CR=1 FL=1